ncbi:MAG: PstS family phosphate ABC transporter substrate-binding protein [Candidatus Rokubacteria bacterium]|nr:PstS family phosphate ABC transporter substrate-binding protein [Candidatus Rokubacteria bacterium]
MPIIQKAVGTILTAVASVGMLGLFAVPARAQQVIKIDGSSTLFPVTEAVAEEFQKARKGAVRVTVGISGTGGGFKKFCRGETDISDASRPILTEEMQACRKQGIQYFELPVAYDALTVAVNPRNDWVGSLTLADLKKIWEPAAQGRITRWNQVRPEWPNQPLKLFGAGADSGTFDYFTEAIVGKAKASRGDFTASEDDHVLVQGIAADRYALGYIPFAYFEPNKSKLKGVAIDGGKGPAAPSLENVLKGTYNPLSRPLFIYVNAQSLGKREVREFVEFYLKHGAALATQVKYLPLPDEAHRMALERLEKKQLGTAFGGHPEVGLPVREILKRTPRL